MTGAVDIGSLDAMSSAVAPIHRLTYDDVRRMYDAGIIDDRDRLELVDGVLVEMSPTGPEHSGAVAWLTEHFVRPGSAWRVAVQDTLLIEGGFLSPDLVVSRRLSRSQLPSTALLVVEVAQTSQRRDAEKSANYARAGVAEYWIVNLVARAVVVHRDPVGDRFRDVRSVGDGASLTPPVDVGAVDVSALLG